MEVGRFTIQNCAKQCLDQFKVLIGIETSTEGNDNHWDPRPGEISTEDQLARFEMWAGNIGVFAEGHASLDYRLRDSDTATKLMTDFLGSLRQFIARGKMANYLKYAKHWY